MADESIYALGSSEREQERLMAMLESFGQKRLLSIVRPGDRILDVGCGPGAVSAALATTVGPTGSVLGIDLQESQLERARRYVSDHGLQNVTFEVGDAIDLAFDDESFDLVYAKLLVMHLPDPLVGLREMMRVLRLGGTLFLYELDAASAVYWPENTPAHRGWELTMEAMRRRGSDPEAGRKVYSYLRQLGFDNVRVIPQMAAGTATQPRFLDGAKQQVAGLIESLREAIVSGGLASREELAQIERDLDIDQADEYITTVGVNCWGKKPL